MTPPAGGNRFATWPRAGSAALLAALALLLIAAALIPISGPVSAPASPAPPDPQMATAAVQRDRDLALYDRIAARVARGDDYYAAATDEQRRGNYPVRPGLAVRLPLLAHVSARLGPSGMMAASILLLIVTLAAWWRRFGEEPGGLSVRPLAVALLLAGLSLSLSPGYLVLHEVWGGLLLLLSLALHRPGRWLASLAVSALALATRELVLPYVLLMAAMAFWRRDRREAAAWALLGAVFLAALAWHLQLVAPHILPTDRPSPSWLAFRGLSGWLSNIVLSSSLHFLPHRIAGPLVVLMLVGWAGWRSPAGLVATLLYPGYALLFMIAGRSNNFYWGAIIAPGMFAGLALAPRALISLGQRALNSNSGGQATPK